MRRLRYSEAKQAYILTEADVQKQVLDYLRVKGYWTHRCTGPLRAAGGLDVYFAKGQVWGGIECKSPRYPGRGPTPVQQQEIYRIRQAGGIAIVARSLEDVIEVLDAD